MLTVEPSDDLYYDACMTQTSISFRADQRTAHELRVLAGGRSVSDTIRDAIHAQYIAGLYAQASADAKRLRDDPGDVAEIRAANDDLDEISAW